MSPRCKLSLGNGRYVQVTEWKGELRVDIREWNNDLPTKKGIGLNLMQYKNLLAGIETFIDPAITENKNESFHLGANGVRKSQTRQSLRRHSTILDTTFGGCTDQERTLFTTIGVHSFKTFVPEIEKLLPELENVMPCYMQDDHANQEGFLRCKYCNPDGYTNW